MAAENKLTLKYDPDGDILYIDTCQPYAEQESQELDDEIVARLNPNSGEVETLEILFFSKRLSEGFVIEMPIETKLELAKILV